MAFIFVRDLDQVVEQVQEYDSLASDGYTKYEAEWPGYNFAKYKIIRNEDGSYTNTMELTHEARIQRRIKWIEAGKRIIAIVADRNDQKNLTGEQVIQMMQTYSVAQNLLLVGALDTAKSIIESVTPDGVIVTNEDKEIILNELNDAITED